VGGAGCGGSRGVDDDPPDPRFEGAVAAELISLLDCAGEALLDRISAKLDAACDRDGDAGEGGKAPPVQRLELSQ
jgi:hypothetical protein